MYALVNIALGAVQRLLLHPGIDVNTPVGAYGWTPLMFMAELGEVEAVELLLKYGPDIDVNRCDRNGNNALMIASYQGQTDVVKLLIESITALDARGIAMLTARDLACLGKTDTDIVEIIDKEVLRRRKIRLRAFLMGTLRREGSRSMIRELPVDVLGVIATRAVAT
eukprot:c9924_g1_i2.p1 GENE.c9924_g1_i2~~c9924_g1_i2.p1  ORF type:complete len:167 (+),score=46.88 c9924_g1_i2:192-692(+)